MKYLRWSALVTLGLALSSAVISCRDHDVSMVTGTTRERPSDTGQSAIDHCVPGQTFQCMGGCGAPATGYQVCAADGRSLGPCICPPFRTLGPIPTYPDRDDGERHIVPRGALVGGLPTPANPSSNPSFGTGGSGGVSVAASVVGAACRSDADCGSGLGCITAAGGQLAGSGPAGGYCSVSCSSDAACRAIDPGSECIGLAGQNLCARSCESRAPQPGVSKCLDRTDVMCVSVAAQRTVPPGDGPQPGLCVPVCQSDTQCGPGLYCNLTTGLCSRDRPSGAPLGSTCTGPESCAGGVCLPLDGFESVCSAFCRFGGPGCGFDGSEANPGAACAFAQVPGEGVGDRGLCLAVCQTGLDCHETGAVCIPTGPDSDTSTCVVPTVPEPDPNAPGTGVPIGSECARDEECGTGGVCLSSATDAFGLGGGFPGGYCSAPCTDSCAAGAVCVGTSDSNRHCLRECTPGTPGGSECDDRPEFTCNALQRGGFCLADCNLGGDCGDRVCDPSSGLCVEAPPGEGPPEPAEPVIGNACAADDECGNGFTCLSSDTDSFAGLGGAPGGYCSAECSPGNPCPDPGDLCLQFPDGNFCLRGCDPSGDADCGARASLACAALDPDQPTLGVCVPVCSSDGECAGRSCDPELGLCVDAAVPECAQDEDCAAGQVCQSGTCLAAPPPAPECAQDEDCTAGQVCQSGTCVAAPPPAPQCTGDEDCPGGVCDSTLGQCVAGPPPPSECTLDRDCPGGVCNPGTAACIAAPPISVGGACTANASCVGGLCLALAGTRFCSGLCLWGTDQGCEAYGIDAFCVLPLSSDPNETRGVCTELCNTAADCAQAGYDCVDIGVTISGRTGTCLPPAPPAPSQPAGATPQSP